MSVPDGRTDTTVLPSGTDVHSHRERTYIIGVTTKLE